MSLALLIVDDSATAPAVIAKTLDLARVPVERVYEASNGSEALDILAGHDVELLKRPDAVALSVDDNPVLLQFAQGTQA